MSSKSRLNLDYLTSRLLYEFTFDPGISPVLVINSERGGMTWDGKAIKGYQMLGNDTRVYLYMVPD